MRRIGIVAAMRGELMPLVRQWPRTDTVFCGQVGGFECFAACEGLGVPGATRSFSAIRAAAGQLDAVVSYGWAGALSCGVHAPDVHVVAEVVDAKTGERYPTQSVHHGPEAPVRLVTLDHVALPAEKRPLAERYKAVLVDMEAAVVARLTRAHGLGFVCLKGISDGYTDELPDVNPFISAEGRLRTGALALHAALRPRYWGTMGELGRNSREAASELARSLLDTLAQARLVF